MQTSVNKFLFYILFLIFLSNCSSSKKEDIVENTQEIDLLGRENNLHGLKIEIYDNGSRAKKYVLK